MRKNYILLCGVLLATSGLFAQTFNDNFDGYTAGAKLAQQSSGAWTTWSNAPGGTEDPLVSNADAYSGANSIYLSSASQTGGPNDLVRQFGGTYTMGTFNLSMRVKVETGKGGYFNIQGVAPIGSMYSIENFFNADGTLALSNTTDGVVLSGTYPQNAWFLYELNIDLNTNTWEVLINSASQGTFANSNNSVWGIDIYPVNSVSPYSAGYYIDDFSTSYTSYTPSGLDAAVTNFTLPGNITGMSAKPTITVRNLGVTPITSFDLKVDYNSIQQTDNITGVNIASGASYTFTSTNSFTLVTGSNTMTATVSNVNGTTDGVATDDAKSKVITPVDPAPGKMAVVEEGTGTWCQWCPRGAVYMDRYAVSYAGFIAPISVHNGDVLTVTDYDAGMAFGSFPNSKVDRGTAQDPSEAEPKILTQLGVAPKAFIKNGATWNATTRELKVSISTYAQAAFTSTYKILCVLTEDSVTGTSSGYNQSNAYSGGGNGPMGGFESLPNPVPASQMNYNFVARALMPSFTGMANSYPSGAVAGDTSVFNFTFTLPATWDENQIHIVGMLRASNGTIDNAGRTTIAEAVANGYVDGTTVTGITELSQIDATIKIYPNPADDYTNVIVNLEKSENVQLKLVDLTGKVIASKNYGNLSGAQQLTIPTASLEAGIYFVQVQIANEMKSLRLVVH